MIIGTKKISVDMRNAGSALKFGKCVPVRKHQLNQEYAITIKHFTSGKRKLL